MARPNPMLASAKNGAPAKGALPTKFILCSGRQFVSACKALSDKPISMGGTCALLHAPEQLRGLLLNEIEVYGTSDPAVSGELIMAVSDALEREGLYILPLDIDS